MREGVGVGRVIRGVPSENNVVPVIHTNEIMHDTTSNHQLHLMSFSEIRHSISKQWESTLQDAESSLNDISQAGVSVVKHLFRCAWGIAKLVKMISCLPVRCEKGPIICVSSINQIILV